LGFAASNAGKAAPKIPENDLKTKQIVDMFSKNIH